ncbi:MAG: FUSC family protein [Micropruina sp.]|nr:MAG: FUSC family protein [Micropruina sp.]
MVALRQAARQGYRRASGALAPVLWATLAAFASYLIAHNVFGHQQPFFAPIAAWVCLGFTFNRVPRKVVELGLGAVLGVALGEAILSLLGSGALQIALGLTVGATLGRLLDRGDLFTMQSGVNAMVVIGMGGTAGASAGVRSHGRRTDRRLRGVRVQRAAAAQPRPEAQALPARGVRRDRHLPGHDSAGAPGRQRHHDGRRRHRTQRRGVRHRRSERGDRVRPTDCAAEPDPARRSSGAG